MLFNSYIFWLFFFVVIAIYWRLPHRAQNRFLLIASYIFYGYWDWRFLSLIAISTLVDFLVALGIANTDRTRLRRAYLTISIVANLGMLGFFKYFDFFIGEFSALLSSLGLQAHIPTLNVILPVGISFYTFQTMSYTIDVYYGKTKPADNILCFALYVSFFPQLIAGPIERSSHLLPQILEPRRLRPDDFTEGLYHVILGLFKKVVIADNMAPIVNRVFATPTDELSGLEILVGLYAFAFQIYGDFSGYSSIAQGIAKWMGIDLSWNFRMPYFSRSPSEFWRRWHISLSSWLRDYLYFTLGGNRGGTVKTFRNLTATMLLGGLWHGANWTFIAWGALHGVLLVVYKALGFGISERKYSWWKHLGQAIFMFHLVCLTWLFFRAESISQAFLMLGQMTTEIRITDFTLYALGILTFFNLPLLAMELRIEKSGNMLYLLEAPLWERFIVYGYCIVMLIVFPPLTPQIFIYFQF